MVEIAGDLWGFSTHLVLDIVQHFDIILVSTVLVVLNQLLNGAVKVSWKLQTRE